MKGKKKMSENFFINEDFAPIYKKTRTNAIDDFAAVSFTHHHATLNQAAAKIIGNTPKLKFFASTNYILILPTFKEDADGYSYRSKYNGKSEATNEVTVPAVLFEDMKLKFGKYRCFEHKGGIVFDRYKPIEVYAKKRKNQFA